MRPWPEDPRPSGVEVAVLRDHGSRVVWGEGNPAATTVGILDNPGAREDAAGRPFVCGTRQTLWASLTAAGLDPDDLYLTYLLKRRPRRAYDHPAAWAASLPLLRWQIAALRPRRLICMGDTVVKALWGLGGANGGREDASEVHGSGRCVDGAQDAWTGAMTRMVASPEASVRAMRGRSDLAWEGWPATVTYHPLAARRRPRLLPLLIADLREAKGHV